MVAHRPSRAKAEPQSLAHLHKCACLEVALKPSFMPSLLLLQPYGVGASIGFSPAVDPIKPNAVIHQIGRV